MLFLLLKQPVQADCAEYYKDIKAMKAFVKESPYLIASNVWLDGEIWELENFEYNPTQEWWVLIETVNKTKGWINANRYRISGNDAFE